MHAHSMQHRCTILVTMDKEAEAVLLENAYIKLTEGRYRQDASKNDKRSIRRKANTLVVQDGVLFYKKKYGKKVCFVDKLVLGSLMN